MRFMTPVPCQGGVGAQRKSELAQPLHVLRCPNCHGHRTLLTGITDPFAIRRILAHFGLPTEVTPLEPPRPPPEPDLPWEVSLAPA